MDNFYFSVGKLSIGRLGDLLRSFSFTKKEPKKVTGKLKKHDGHLTWLVSRFCGTTLTGSPLMSTLGVVLESLIQTSLVFLSFSEPEGIGISAKS